MPNQLTIISANPLGVISVIGDDAQSFLQGQSTPDLRRLGVDHCVFGAFCNAQGRVIANGWFQRMEEGFRLVISRDLIALVIKRLKMYALRAKVVINDESDASPLWLIKGNQADLSCAWKIEGPMGLNLVAANSALLPSDAHFLHGEAFQLSLIQAGIPLVSEKTRERFIPHMLSMDVLGGLSFDKGCYTGQEIVTRTQFLGKVKRTLHRLACDDNIHPESGSPVKASSSEEPVGELFSWSLMPGGGGAGLAVIRNEAVEEIPLEIEGYPVEVSSVAGD